MNDMVAKQADRMKRGDEDAFVGRGNRYGIGSRNGNRSRKDRISLLRPQCKSNRLYQCRRSDEK